MAEVLLYVTGDPTRTPDNPLSRSTYQNGDVIKACTDRLIAQTWLSHLCHQRRAGFTAEGLRPDGIAREFQQATRTYAFERVSADEVLRTDLTTMESEVLGATPNEAGEHIYVAEYLRRVTGHGGHKVFGTRGAERWYGGRKRYDATTLASVWDMVEGETPLRRADYQRAPMSEWMLRRHLVVPVDDMRDEVAQRMTVDEVDWDEGQAGYNSRAKPGAAGNRMTTRARRARIDWLSLGLVTADVLSVRKRIDLRGERDPLDHDRFGFKSRLTEWAPVEDMRARNDRSVFVEAVRG